MRKIAAGVAAASALALVATGAGPASAARGDTPLAAVLTSDGDKFDHNWHDYDIVTASVLKVLKEKPKSAVGVLADGDVKLTAFIPNDNAFRLLVKDLTGSAPATERATFRAVKRLGIDTVETVLLYHVVPGAPITAKQALKADGVKLETAAGVKVKVKVKRGNVIKLADKDRDARNARVVQANINKGNKQIAHGVDRVLRPINL